MGSMKRLITFALLMPTVAMAIELPTIQKVLCAITMPSKIRRAMLVEGKKGVDFYLFEKDKLLTYKDNVMAGGTSADKMPDLSLSPSGELILRSQNSNKRHGHYQQTMTLMIKNNKFLITQFTYQYKNVDKTETISESCEMNLLSGLVVVNDKRFKLKTRAIPLQRWAIDIPVKVCGFS